MMVEIASLALSFLLVWHGRDKVWTPTFEGDQVRRFAQAMSHYCTKMGIKEDLVYDFRAKREKGQEKRCASVQRARVKLPGFVTENVVIVRWFGEEKKECGDQKPEYWALHEACHLRMAHHDIGSVMTADQKHNEVKTCMGWYSEKERR